MLKSENEKQVSDYMLQKQFCTCGNKIKQTIINLFLIVAVILGFHTYLDIEPMKVHFRNNQYTAYIIYFDFLCQMLKSENEKQVSDYMLHNA
jgi:hypothetical protein